MARARKGSSDLRNCDVALTLAEDAGPAATTLWREPYLLAVPRHHKLATRDRCSVHDLADMPFVVRRHCEVSERAAASFADHGVRPPVRLRTTDDQLTWQVVAAGLAAAFMPRALIGPELGSLSILELPWERRIVAAMGEAPKPAARDFVRFAASHDWSAGEWRIAH